MGKMIQADTFHGQTMFLNWRGYHSSTSNGVLFDSGWSTNLTYPYATIIPPFKGCINKVNITNNPYSSYQSGPTGSKRKPSRRPNSKLHSWYSWRGN